jgi:glycosyltransferase involved in cell wall biosynthesis
VPEVAVVIPAHNPGPHLARSLGSVLAQDFTDWECVVVDDGSAEPVGGLDATAVDPRVRVVRQPNAGVSVARNVGVALTDSRWVAFLDQDDEWHPAKLRRQVELLRADEGAAFAHSGFVWRLPHTDLPATEVRATYRESLACRAYVLMSSLVVAREHYTAIGGSDPLLAQQQDWALVLDLLRRHGPAVYAPEPLATYYVHDANASRNYVRAAAEARRVLEAHRVAAHFAGDRETLAAVRDGLAQVRRLHGSQAVENARSAKASGDWAGVATHLGAAVQLSPGVLMQAVARSALEQGRHVRSRVQAR